MIPEGKSFVGKVKGLYSDGDCNLSVVFGLHSLIR
jgi:hypothetical protein